MRRNRQIFIKGVGSYIPPNRVTNDDLAKLVDTTDQWIYSHTGIKSRHIAQEGVATSDLATNALLSLLSENNIEREEIGAIIVATATQDYLGFPSTACIVQDKLGLSKIAAFDISAGCTGFIYALEIARGMLSVGSVDSVAVVGAEKLSAVTNWSDRSSCVLFGDGAGAVLLTRGEHGGFIDSVLHAEGSGSHYLYIPHGGTYAPHTEKSIKEGQKLKMDGRAVYNFATRVIVEVIETLLKRNQVTIDEVDWIVPHQANSRIISAAAKRLSIDEKKFFVNIEEYGNTSAASIPIALHEMRVKNLLHKGDLVLTVGFGAGLTYGGNLFRW